MITLDVDALLAEKYVSWTDTKAVNNIYKNKKRIGQEMHMNVQIG